MRYLKNFLLRWMASIWLFILFIGLPFIVCLTITQHSTHPLWSVLVAFMSLAGFIGATSRFYSKKGVGVNVCYRKEVLCRVAIWIGVMILAGLSAYLPFSWAYIFFGIFVIVYLILTEQLAQVSLYFIWRREKIALA